MFQSFIHSFIKNIYWASIKYHTLYKTLTYIITANSYNNAKPKITATLITQMRRW